MSKVGDGEREWGYERTKGEDVRRGDGEVVIKENQNDADATNMDQKQRDRSVKGAAKKDRKDKSRRRWDRMGKMDRTGQGWMTSHTRKYAGGRHRNPSEAAEK